MSMVAIIDNCQNSPANISSSATIMTAQFTIIKPAGVLDGVKANQLCQQVSQSLALGHNFVMLDLADVNFIDSSGLGALIIALKMLRTAGGDLYLCSIAEPVRSLLSMTRMDRLFENSLVPALMRVEPEKLLK